MNKLKYYLSFDCATKTFAYVLVSIDYKYYLTNFKELKDNIDTLSTESLVKLDYITKNTVRIIEAKCIDFFPNIDNKKISTIDRVKKMVEYVKSNILPLIETISKDDIDIVVEFQMSYNTQSKVISIGLITLFSEYNIYLVNPTLKNKISLTERGKYSYFIEKYKSNYTANKEHALYNFKTFEDIFDQHVQYPNSMKKNIADAFLQIFGLILHSPTYKQKFG